MGSTWGAIRVLHWKSISDLISARVSVRGLRTDTQSQPYKLHHIIIKYMIKLYICRTCFVLFHNATYANNCNEKICEWNTVQIKGSALSNTCFCFRIIMMNMLRMTVLEVANHLFINGKWHNRLQHTASVYWWFTSCT